MGLRFASGQDDVGAHDAEDGAGRPGPVIDGGTEEVGGHAAAQPRQEVQGQEPALAQHDLDRRPDDEEGDHVEGDVQEVEMQEHRREEPVVLVQEVDPVGLLPEAHDDGGARRTHWPRSR